MSFIPGKLSCLAAGMLIFGVLSVAQTVKPGSAQPQSAPAAVPGQADASVEASAGGSQRRVVQEGLAVDFSIEPAKPDHGPAAELRQGDPVTFRFHVSDTTTGRPVTNAHPAAWVDLLASGQKRSPELCLDKLKSFLGGGFNAVPTSDLNVFLAVAMNADSTLSVIDPLFGYGDSKLLTLVSLPAPGYDWALTQNESSLFVSVPNANQVVLVDTKSWTIASRVDVLLRPSRLAIQPDQHYLWVASSESAPDARDSGVTVLTTDGLKPAARIVTGKGSHEIVFTADSRFAFVSNSAQNTVDVIDVGTLKKIKELNTGLTPSSLAYSNKAGTVYVANTGDGTIVAIDATRHEVIATMKAAPGVTQVRFTPDGRFAFAVNPAKNEAYIMDAASHQLVQTFDTKTKPDQVSFTDTLAYIRHQGSDEVLMVPLDQIGKRGQPVAAADFPAGNNPPGMGADSPAPGIVQTPGETAVLVADPKDKSIYYYREGMAAPMGTFSNYGREPRAVVVVDRSLREKSTPGVYESSGVLGRPGIYDVVFFLDSPKFVHCFPVRVAPNPALAQHGVKVHFLTEQHTAPVGEKLRVVFRLADEETQAPKDGGRDVQVLAYLAPGAWSSREAAKPTGEAGVYAIEFAAPRPGVYYLHVGSATLGIKENNQEYFILRAFAQGAMEPSR